MCVTHISLCASRYMSHIWVYLHPDVCITYESVLARLRSSGSRCVCLCICIYLSVHVACVHIRIPGSTSIFVQSIAFGVSFSFSILNRWSSSLGLFYHVLLERDQGDWEWRLRLNDTPNAIGWTCMYPSMYVHINIYLYISLPVYRLPLSICPSVYVQTCIYLYISLALYLLTSVYMSICVCAYIYIPVYIVAFVSAYLYLYVHLCMWKHVYTYIYRCLCICLPLSICPSVYVQIYIPIYLFSPLYLLTSIYMSICVCYRSIHTYIDTLQHAWDRHIATHCTTLQHTATHCNTLQHTATHSNTLQHTATHMR